MLGARDVADNDPLADAVVCQICSLDLNNQDLNQRQQHYERHFIEDVGHQSWRIPPASPVKQGPKPFKNLLQRSEGPFWYSALNVPPPSNYTPGLVNVLSHALQKLQTSGRTQGGILCYERVVYISRETWDASWGCGYRNFLMACATLMDQQLQPLYFPLLDAPIPPGVRNLQQWIENAWKEGFDAQGYKELEQLVNTKKWIGTSDIWVAFVSRGVPAELVDFDLRKTTAGVQPLINWIVAYFSLPSLSQLKNFDTSSSITDYILPTHKISVTDRMPLILQHDGHSRAIVGYEVLKDNRINLLAFDPSKLPGGKLRKAGLSSTGTHFNTVESAPDASKRHPRKLISRSTASDSKPPSSVSSPSKHRSLLEFFHAVPTHHKRKSSLDSLNSNQKRTRTETSMKRQDGPGPSTPIRFKAASAAPTSRDVIELTDDSDVDEVMFINRKEIDARDIPIEDARKNEPAQWMDELLPSHVLNFFRLDSQRLEKKKQYQILYFPMNAPLTEQERLERKIVRSTRIC